MSEPTVRLAAQMLVRVLVHMLVLTGWPATHQASFHELKGGVAIVVHRWLPAKAGKRLAHTPHAHAHAHAHAPLHPRLAERRRLVSDLDRRPASAT